jgi:hypothetical protein
MGIEIGGILGLIVIVLDLIAIVNILNSGGETSRQVIWVLVILFLPVIGFILWLLMGPRRVR